MSRKMLKTNIKPTIKKAKSPKVVTPIATEVTTSKIDVVESKPMKSNGFKRNRSNSKRSFKIDNLELKSAVKKDFFRERVPEGMGFTGSSFRSFYAVDEDAFVPLALLYGHYWPVGSGTYIAGDFQTYANAAILRMLTKMKDKGYAIPYTSGNVQSYIASVSHLIQLHQFLTELISLSKLLSIHNAIPISVFTNYAINGRLIAIHRRLGSLLEGLPMPPSFIDLFIKAFRITTLSEDPNSGIRMFVPKSIQPVTPGDPILADNLFTIVSDAMNTVFSSQVLAQLATTLPYPTIKLPNEITAIGMEHNTINNILNFPYFDGIGQNPQTASDVTLPIFFRDRLSIEGCATISTPTRNYNLWSQSVGVERATAIDAITDAGNTFDVYTDVNVFSGSGVIWEASVGLEPANCPSVSKAYATGKSIVDGLTQYIYKDI